MQNYFLETERLIIQKMTLDDFDDIAQMLLNPMVMYAWEHRFTEKEVIEWICKNLHYYEEYGYAYFLALDKHTEQTVGQVALLQDTINGTNYHEIGYIIKKEYWGNGYAYEAAQGLIKYAFQKLNAPEVIAEIRPMNIWSINIAKKLGMKHFGEFNKNVRGKMMLHLIYKIENPNYNK